MFAAVSSNMNRSAERMGKQNHKTTFFLDSSVQSCWLCSDTSMSTNWETHVCFQRDPMDVLQTVPAPSQTKHTEQLRHCKKAHCTELHSVISLLFICIVNPENPTCHAAYRQPCTMSVGRPCCNPQFSLRTATGNIFQTHREQKHFIKDNQSNSFCTAAWKEPCTRLWFFCFFNSWQMRSHLPRKMVSAISWYAFFKYLDLVVKERGSLKGRGKGTHVWVFAVCEMLMKEEVVVSVSHLLRTPGCSSRLCVRGEQNSRIPTGRRPTFHLWDWLHIWTPHQICMQKRTVEGHQQRTVLLWVEHVFLHF